jgi:site-specific recombinase XerD
VATARNYFSFVLGAKLSFDDLPYPRKQEKLIEVFSIAEIKQLFSVIHNLKHRAITSLIYGCGLRISEVLNLKPADIDSSRMIINVRQSKGNKDRQVMLDPKLLDLLREYFKSDRPKEYLFNGQFGNRYSESSVNQFLKYYAKRAGIKKRIHAHLLRHCFAVHMIESGNDMSILQKLLGHNNIKTTQHYAKISTALISKVHSPLSLIA